MKLAREIGHVVNERSRASGRFPVLATLTVRHSARDPIEICKAVRSKCWKKFVAGKPWIQFRARFGLEWIAAEEVTRGDNGWHPHMHVLLLPGRDSGDVLGSREWWHERWSRIVERELGADNVPSWEHGTDLRYSDRAEYLSKLGLDEDPTPFKLGLELTDAKAVKGRAPMQLLVRALEGDRAALDFFVALQLSRHRCRDVTYSKGASALRDTLPPPPPSELALALRGSEYERIAVKGDAALLSVLAAVMTGEAASVASALLGADLADPVDVPTPPRAT